MRCRSAARTFPGPPGQRRFGHTTVVFIVNLIRWIAPSGTLLLSIVGHDACGNDGGCSAASSSHDERVAVPGTALNEVPHPRCT